MTLNVNWQASDAKQEISGEHYKGFSDGLFVGELVVDPKEAKSGMIIGAFTVESTKIFDQVAAEAATFAALDSKKTMPRVIRLTEDTGLITQPN